MFFVVSGLVWMLILVLVIFSKLLIFLVVWIVMCMLVNFFVVLSDCLILVRSVGLDVVGFMGIFCFLVLGFGEEYFDSYNVR